jgi:hypothetical protein
MSEIVPKHIKPGEVEPGIFKELRCGLCMSAIGLFCIDLLIADARYQQWGKRMNIADGRVEDCAGFKAWKKKNG